MDKHSSLGQIHPHFTDGGTIISCENTHTNNVMKIDNLKMISCIGIY